MSGISSGKFMEKLPLRMYKRLFVLVSECFSDEVQVLVNKEFSLEGGNMHILKIAIIFQFITNFSIVVLFPES